jgi:hypothetical protein
MRQKMSFLLYIFFFYLPSFSVEANLFEIKNLKNFLHSKNFTGKNLNTTLEQGDIFVKSLVRDDSKAHQQSLDFKIIGIHPSSCAQALPKLSYFEQYSKLIDFIKTSSYDETKQEVYFLLESNLLPVKMSLSFRIPRIKTPGIYDFHFDHGYFAGLKGKIHAYDYKNKCLIYTESDWKGKDTGFPNLAVEIFSETLSRISMEKMFRITK